jgi:hypothetical protein
MDSDDNIASPVRGNTTQSDMILDPFEPSDLNYLDSTADLSISQFDEPEISTYGQLVNEIYKCGSTVLRYHEDYLKTRSTAPPEESPQYDFVSKGDYLCAGEQAFSLERTERQLYFQVVTSLCLLDIYSRTTTPRPRSLRRDVATAIMATASSSSLGVVHLHRRDHP